ncbi:MAG: hypothetical protein HUJ68_04860 [Clostridia bacterium]|nr:hypothetical protein [Clostridia bacterium]
MNCFRYEFSSIEDMLSRNDYAFAVRESDSFKLYIPDENGSKYTLLNEKMKGDSDDLLVGFYNQVNPVFKDVFKDKKQSVVKVLTLMFLFLKVNYGDLVKGGFSYASHSQGFISFYNDRNSVTNYLKEQFDCNLDCLEFCYNNYLREVKANGRSFYLLQNAVENVKNEAGKRVQNGEITFADEKTEVVTLSESLFHQTLYNNTEFIDKVKDSIDFKKKRFATICFYYFLKNIGINYKQRCIYAYLIYQYIERKFDFNYIDLIQAKRDMP